jgi:hypothetical protein
MEMFEYQPLMSIWESLNFLPSTALKSVIRIMMIQLLPQGFWPNAQKLSPIDFCFKSFDLFPREVQKTLPVSISKAIKIPHGDFGVSLGDWGFLLFLLSCFNSRSEKV